MSILEHWFQSLYKGATTRYRAKTQSIAVDGVIESQRLSALIHLLSPTPCITSVSESQRVVVNEGCIYIPASFSPTDSFCDNSILLDYAVVLAAQSMLRLARSNAGLLYDPRALEQKALESLPGFSEIIERVNRIERSHIDIKKDICPVFENQDRFLGKLTSMPSGRSNDDKKSGAHLNILSTPKLVEKNEEETNPLMHCFEKGQTAEEYQNGSKTTDDLEDGAADQTALDEIKFSKVIRTNSLASSFSESDVSLESQGEVSAKNERDTDNVYSYSEWSHKNQTYIKNWCRLFERKSEMGITSHQISDVCKYQGMQLRKYVEGLLNGRGWEKRYESGEVDIDAAIRYFSVPMSARNEAPRLFERQVLTHKDVAWILAIDSSLSSDSWVCNRRVLDVAKNVLHMLCVAFDRSDFRVEVTRFYSMTKEACAYEIVKNFNQPWAGVPQRIEAIAPQGYTRIGPIIRHANQRLRTMNAKRKIILLIGDAKPTDYDPYEGTHGIYDVRKAVQEAASANVHVESLIISKNNDKRFQTMFGSGHFGKIEDEASAIIRLRHIVKKIVM